MKEIFLLLVSMSVWFKKVKLSCTIVQEVRIILDISCVTYLSANITIRLRYILDPKYQKIKY